jgi:protein-tyrosine phosphatase
LIDLHCHYLPFVDDGPDSVQQAVQLVALSLSRGISHAVLTPHVYPGIWDNTLEALQPKFDAFVRLLAQSGLPLSLTLGGEVRLHPECLEMATRGTLPTLGTWEGDRVVLLELPDGNVPVGAEAAVSFLRARGYRPMIAHPERNKDVMADYRRMKPFVDAGCLLQITAASVIGGFGANAQRAALQLLDTGAVTVIATDAHNLAHRPPLLAEARGALLARYGAEVAEALTLTTPARILGIPVEARPDTPPAEAGGAAVLHKEPSGAV